MRKTCSLSFVAALAVAVFTIQGGDALAGGTLEKIRKSGKLTVGTEAAFPPFEFVKDGKIVGFGKDILDVIVADLGVKLNQLDLPFTGIYPGLLAGKFDFIATTLILNQRSVKKFAFTMPIAEGSSTIARRTGDKRINKVDNLSGKVVGSQLGTGSERMLRKVNIQFKKRGMAPMNLKLFTSSPEAFLALSNRQIDAAVSLLPMVRRLAGKKPELYEVVGRVLVDKEFIGWATRADDTELRDYLNSVIKKLNDSGKLYELQQKWFGLKMKVPTTGYMPKGGI